MADSIHPAPAPDEVPRRDGVMTAEEQQEALRLLDRCLEDDPFSGPSDDTLWADVGSFLASFRGLTIYKRAD